MNGGFNAKMSLRSSLSSCDEILQIATQTCLAEEFQAVVNYRNSNAATVRMGEISRIDQWRMYQVT
jgi:hypothetical protein